MHELSIVEALVGQIEALAKQHNAIKVTQVELEMGEFSNVVPQLLDQAFTAYQGVKPLISGARLEIREVPLTLLCQECQAEFHPLSTSFECPHCRSLSTRIVRGEELLLRNVELELEELEDG